MGRSDIAATLRREAEPANELGWGPVSVTPVRSYIDYSTGAADTVYTPTKAALRGSRVMTTSDRWVVPVEQGVVRWSLPSI